MKRLLSLTLTFFFYTILFSQNVIKMEKEGGVFKIPCVVNGLRLKFVLDTGAAAVSLSSNIANMMFDNGYIDKGDIIGTSTARLADGRTVTNIEIILKEIKIGDYSLNNVRAWVSENQSAPLLLGQSALKQIGNYSIEGDKLIFASTSFSREYNDLSELSESEVENLLSEAINAYNSELYSVAAERYGILYKHNYLNLWGKNLYGNSLFFNHNNNEALKIYQSILSQMDKSDFKYAKMEIYYRIGICLKQNNQYKEAIPYFEKSRLLCDKWSEFEFINVHQILDINCAINKPYDGDVYVKRFLNQYLNYKKWNITDCWNKKISDEKINDLLFYLYNAMVVSTRLPEEYENYLLLSAAWGNTKAKKMCNEYGINYRTKPNNIAL